ncbi:MAG: hypothetical protein TREMPRED_005356 [Tremellales sp. Tagirdzhanova-0007]|nr:MAG: hypothetical protein TREMPRED_005356 [Tremellales sp. Tagirdzhanova-0007]
MLRVIRQRLGRLPCRPLANRPRSASTSSLAVAREDGGVEVVYGVQSAAGPSRLPFKSTMSKPTESDRFASPVCSTASNTLSSASGKTSQAIRQALQILDVSQLSHSAGMDVLREALGIELPLHTLSRLKLHLILHRLIRSKSRLSGLAARIIHDAIKHGRDSKPQRRRLVAFRTLVALFRDPAEYDYSEGQLQFTSRAPHTTTPTMADHAPALPSYELSCLLNLLEALQSIRNRRPIELYDLIIGRCREERLPDIAAKVYVGMVEEWIVEGRVAEGLEPDEDFYEGGGPPRNADTDRLSIASSKKGWDLRRELRLLYWKTVRTWTLPGEVLSPHDRLDLWHPHNLALGEKLRNFPYPDPQSPPMLVPAPHDRLLSIVLGSLQLDPDIASPTDFAASMRACAMLASTILNRTLPILSQAKVLEILGDTPRHPPIYPEKMTEPPSEDDAWAYQACTHIHLAFQSLFLRPPINHDSVQYIKAAEHAKLAGHPPPSAPAPTTLYMLPPLCYRACMSMIKYGLRKLRRPHILENILLYMKSVSPLTTSLYNILLRGSTLARDNTAADQLEKILFGATNLAKREGRSSKFEKVSVPSARQSDGYGNMPSAIASLVVPSPDKPVSPDLKSLLALIPHLTATSQFDRLVQITYELIPFLAFSKSMTPEELSTSIQRKGVEPGVSGRPRPEALPLHIYACLLVGFEKGRVAALPSRVFSLAQQAETALTKSHLERHPDIPAPPSCRLGIEVFTSMLLIWRNEAELSNARFRQGSQLVEWPKGWALPQGYSRLPWRIGVNLMIIHTYNAARVRWRNGEPLRPDVMFFNAMVKASVKRWDLHSKVLLKGRVKEEVEQVVEDMREHGVPIPPWLDAKLGRSKFPMLVSELNWGKYIINKPMHTRRRIDFAKDWQYLRRLASLQIRGENERPASVDEETEEDFFEEKEEGDLLEEDGAEETRLTEGSFKHSRRYAT